LWRLFLGRRQLIGLLVAELPPQAVAGNDSSRRLHLNAAAKKLSFLGHKLAAVMIGRLLQMPGRYAAGI
jgi:hypothetical protein